MIVYVTPVRILTTGVALVGIIAHCLVAYLTKKKAKSDHSAYVLLMQIYSVSTIIRLFTGWLVIYRLVLFVPYPKVYPPELKASVAASR